MKEFKKILLNMNQKLDVPQPSKSRILLEISSDMNDLYTHYISRGDTPSRAIKKVEDHFELDEQNLKELIAIHQTPLKKLIDTFNLGKGATFKKVLLYILIAFVVGICVFSIQATPFFSQSSRYVYPVGTIAIMTMAILLYKFYQLHLIKDHALPRLRRGMSAILFGMILTFLVGVAGFSIEIYETLYSVFVPLHDLIFNVTPDQGVSKEVYQTIINWGLRISSLVMITLGFILVLGILWLLVTQKIKQVEMLEAQNLLYE